MKDYLGQRQRIATEFNEQQDKLVYYIIALCVSAIGFSVYQTTGKPLSLLHIPLGLAVASWATSIFCGFRFKKYILSNLFANAEHLEIIAGKSPTVGADPELIQAASDAVRYSLEQNARHGKSCSLWHHRLFYTGMILFMVWHVLEMYLLSCE